MRSAGIICECNPLHDGHLYLLNALKKAGNEICVAVMSGCFVQRGDVAVTDPYARAEILIDSGFDLVLELPFPYSSSGAEFFGRAGIEILSHLGVGEVWFGSESGALEPLQACVAVAESEAFLSRYRDAAKSESGTAGAYFSLLRDMCREEELSFEPNDILALSYLRAIKKLGSDLRPMTVRRVGDAFDETVIHEKSFPSAKALRRAWYEEGLDAIRTHLPPSCFRVLEREVENGCAPASLLHLERSILSHLRLSPSEALDNTAELSGGLGRRLREMAMRSRSLEELFESSACKTYTDARVRRGILFSMMGVEVDDLRREVAYTRLLGANDRGLCFLRGLRKTSEICVVTKNREIPDTPAARRQLELEGRAKALYSLAIPKACDASDLMRCAPYLELGEKNLKNS